MHLRLVAGRGGNGSLIVPDQASGDVSLATGMAQSEIRHVDVAEVGPDLVFITDSAGRIVHVNARWVEYTGADLAALQAQAYESPLGILHPGDLGLTMERWKRALETGETFETQYRLRSAQDGRYRWFLARAVPVRDESGALTNWAGTVTDIDRQIRAGDGSRFLSDAATVLSSSIEADKVLSDFAKSAVRQFSDCCLLVFLDGEICRLGAFAHRDPSFVPSVRPGTDIHPAQDGPILNVVRTKQPYLKSVVTDEDLRARAHDEEDLWELRRLGAHSFVAVPMIVVDRLIGVLCFISSDDSRPFENGDVEVATAAGRQLAVALENIRSFERFRLLARATDQLFSVADSSTKLHRLLGVMAEEVADWAAIYVLGAGRTIRLQDVVHRDPAKAQALAEARGQRVFNLHSEQLFYDTLMNHRSILRPRAGIERLRETLKPYLLPIFAQAVPQSMLTVPLFTSEDVYGALTVYAERRTFGEGDLELMQEIARRVALAFEHDESVERERRLTRTLQEVTLPAQLPNVPGAVVSTVYTPAATSDAQLGGDWYDIFALGKGRFLLSIGDVTGRGLQASAIMGKLRHSINVVAMYESDPARVLDAAETVLNQRYPDAIATTFIALYDVNDGSVVYANAGHPYPLLRMRHGGIEQLVADGLPIGLRRLDAPARARSRKLDDVEMLIFYTDGIVEATRDSTIGEARLQRAVESGALPFVRSSATLIASACLPPQAQDDAAILSVCFPKTTTWWFQADHARAAADARWAFVNQLRREGVDQEDVDIAEIIFGELVANVVRHAPGAIDIALEWSEGSAVLHVTDRGRGFSRTPRRQDDPLKETGRGLWLVEQFGGTIDIEPIEGFGTHVRVALPVRRTEPQERTLTKI